MKQRILIAFVMLLVPIASAQVYTITDLGPLSPTAINSWAQVVGNYNGQAYIWNRQGGMRDLGILAGGTFSRAAAINDLGAVTGTADGAGTVISLDPGTPNQECSNLTQPFHWTQGNGMRGLGTVMAPTEQIGWCSIAFYGAGINGLGQIVGYSQSSAGEFQWGFSWTASNGMTFFGGSWPPTFVNAVSNTAQIVGENGVENSFGHATSWKRGLATDLGSLVSGTNFIASAATGVNDRGQIVGWSATTSVFLDDCYYVSLGNCPMHAVLWTASGAISDLGTLPGDSLSAASKINLWGMVIGSSGNTATYSNDGFADTDPPEVIGRPFIWSERDGMRDLNTLIRGNSGWVLNSASDINVWGQIVGEGTLHGQPHGFLLTPKNPFKL